MDTLDGVHMTSLDAATVPMLQNELFREIRAVVTPEGGSAAIAARVADVLRAYLSRRELLTPEQCEPDPHHYRQCILYVDPNGDFSMVALVWLPGQATPIHDHVSWCVVGVYEGQELETRYEWSGEGES